MHQKKCLLYSSPSTCTSTRSTRGRTSCRWPQMHARTQTRHTGTFARSNTGGEVGDSSGETAAGRRQHTIGKYGTARWKAPLCYRQEGQQEYMYVSKYIFICNSVRGHDVPCYVRESCACVSTICWGASASLSLCVSAAVSGCSRRGGSSAWGCGPLANSLLAVRVARACECSTGECRRL